MYDMLNISGSFYQANVTWAKIDTPGSKEGQKTTIKYRTAQIQAVILNKQNTAYKRFYAILGAQLKITCTMASNAIVPKDSVR